MDTLIGYSPGGVVLVAMVVRSGLPVTPLLPRFSPTTNPEHVAVRGGLVAPKILILLSAVTVSHPGVMTPVVLAVVLAE
jgi:hypothetical protein